MAVATQPPREGLEFPARCSAVFAGRNFPGRLMEGKISLVSWSGQPARLQRACGEAMGEVGNLKMEILKMGKLEKHV